MMRWHDRPMPNWAKIVWAVLMVGLVGTCIWLVVYGVMTDPRMCGG